MCGDFGCQKYKNLVLKQMSQQQRRPRSPSFDLHERPARRRRTVSPLTREIQQLPGIARSQILSFINAAQMQPSLSTNILSQQQQQGIYPFGNIFIPPLYYGQGVQQGEQIEPFTTYYVNMSKMNTITQQNQVLWRILTQRYYVIELDRAPTEFLAALFHWIDTCQQPDPEQTWTNMLSHDAFMRVEWLRRFCGQSYPIHIVLRNIDTTREDQLRRARSIYQHTSFVEHNYILGHVPPPSRFQVTIRDNDEIIDQLLLHNPQWAQAPNVRFRLNRVETKDIFPLCNYMHLPSLIIEQFIVSTFTSESLECLHRYVITHPVPISRLELHIPFLNDVFIPTDPNLFLFFLPQLVQIMPHVRRLDLYMIPARERFQSRIDDVLAQTAAAIMQWYAQEPTLFRLTIHLLGAANLSWLLQLVPQLSTYLDVYLGFDLKDNDIPSIDTMATLPQIRNVFVQSGDAQIGDRLLNYGFTRHDPLQVGPWVHYSRSLGF